MSNSSDNLMDVEAGGEQTQCVVSIFVPFPRISPSSNAHID
jgi:hypothetical protein